MNWSLLFELNMTVTLGNLDLVLQMNFIFRQVSGEYNSTHAEVKVRIYLKTQNEVPSDSNSKVVA